MSDNANVGEICMERSDWLDDIIQVTMLGHLQKPRGANLIGYLGSDKPSEDCYYFNFKDKKKITEISILILTSAAPFDF